MHTLCIVREKVRDVALMCKMQLHTAMEFVSNTSSIIYIASLSFCVCCFANQMCDARAISVIVCG